MEILREMSVLVRKGCCENGEKDVEGGKMMTRDVKGNKCQGKERRERRERK